MARPDAQADPEAPLPPKYRDFPLKPFGYKKFWALIKRRQVDGECGKEWQGIRLTKESLSHKCGMCSSERKVDQELCLAQLQLEALPVNQPNKEISKNVTRLEQMCGRRVRHKKQLAHQRTWIKTNVTAELSLTNKTCMMQLDFVSFYNSNGAKMYNLVCVLHYRVHDDGTPPSSLCACFRRCSSLACARSPRIVLVRSSCLAVVSRFVPVSLSLFSLVAPDELQRFYIDNFYFGKGTSASTISILDYLLGSTNVFENFDHIVLSGDTGSGFRQTETMYFYSKVFHLYGKHMSVELLAPGHAWNMCDSHGGHLSDLFAPLKMTNELVTPQDACNAVNSSSMTNTTAFMHENPHVRPAEEEHYKQVGITNYLSFQFAYSAADGTETHTEGVCVARELSGKDKWKVFDLRENLESQGRSLH